MLRRIGGSDISKLLGWSSYGGPPEVFDRCVLGIEKRQKNPRAASRGLRMESPLRSVAAERFGFEIVPHSGVGPNADYYEHPDNDFAHAQIDSLAFWGGRPVIIDFKSQNIWAQRLWGPDGSDVVPNSIHAQVTWGMSCLDVDLAVLVVGFGVDVEGPEVFQLSHVVTYFVERDPVFESYCLSVGKEFWVSHVLPGVRPNKTTGSKRKAS